MLSYDADKSGRGTARDWGRVHRAAPRKTEHARKRWLVVEGRTGEDILLSVFLGAALNVEVGARSFGEMYCTSTRLLFFVCVCSGLKRSKDIPALCFVLSAM